MQESFQINTPRLVLREIQMNDDAQILSAMACPEIAAMHSGGFSDLAAVQRYIAVLVQEYADNKYRTLAIAEQSENLLIGTITIDIHKFFPRAELGYWIAMPYRNKGYASEAVKAVIEYGIGTLDLGRIQATHHAGNEASGRVLKKAGMTFEGTLRRYYEMNGFFTDECMYSFIKSDLDGE